MCISIGSGGTPRKPIVYGGTPGTVVSTAGAPAKHKNVQETPIVGSICIRGMER